MQYNGHIPPRPQPPHATPHLNTGTLGHELRKMRKRSSNSANPFLALFELGVDAVHFIREGSMTNEGGNSMCTLLAGYEEGCLGG